MNSESRIIQHNSPTRLAIVDVESDRSGNTDHHLIGNSETMTSPMRITWHTKDKEAPHRSKWKP
jgi:hypothetical protein